MEVNTRRNCLKYMKIALSQKQEEETKDYYCKICGII